MTASPGQDAHDVAVIGAGLAGLRCAIRLAGAGLDVVLLEAQDDVGGRQRTDAVDGFLLDRGFQVLNPAYPAVQRWADVGALDLQSFPVGVRVRRAGRTVELAHPVRHPDRIAATLASGLVTPVEVVALARWAAGAVVSPRSAIRAAESGDDRTLLEAWDRVGVRGALRHEVLEPFLAGVLADDGGATSDAFVRLLVRMFALGRPGLPAEGIAALPRQLAASARGLGVDVRTQQRATGVRRVGGVSLVDMAGADAVAARSVVVAVGGEAVAALTDLPPQETRGLQTWWLRAPQPGRATSMLVLDGLRRGPILHTSVVSQTAPTYAPAGHALVEATCLLPTDGVGPSERTIRTQLRELWGSHAEEWEVLRRDDVRHALPALRPPLRTTSAPRVAAGTYVAGDHRDTASIQGALVSGDRVALAVLDDLGVASASG